MKVYEKRLHFILLEESVADNSRASVQCWLDGK